QRHIFLLQPADLVRNINGGIRLHEPELFDLAFELCQRLLELQVCITHRNLISRYWLRPTVTVLPHQGCATRTKSRRCAMEPKPAPLHELQSAKQVPH